MLNPFALARRILEKLFGKKRPPDIVIYFDPLDDWGRRWNAMLISVITITVVMLMVWFRILFLTRVFSINPMEIPL